MTIITDFAQKSATWAELGENSSPLLRQRHLGQFDQNLDGPLLRRFTRMAGKMVLAVGWELSHDCGQGALVPLHMGPSTDYLGFLSAWRLASKSKHSKKTRWRLHWASITYPQKSHGFTPP